MEKDKIIKDAQYRKGLSIAYFNSLNASIELAKAMFPEMEGVDVKAFITEYRDWFLDEHAKYYATVIANVGSNYKAEDSIAKLKETTTYDSLKSTWLSLSEDERRDGEIIKVVQELKLKYKNEEA